MLDKIDRFILNNENVFSSLIYSVSARQTEDKSIQIEYEKKIDNEQNEDSKMDLYLQLFMFQKIPFVIEMQSFTNVEFGSLYGQLPRMNASLAKFVEAEMRRRQILENDTDHINNSVVNSIDDHKSCDEKNKDITIRLLTDKVKSLTRKIRFRKFNITEDDLRKLVSDNRKKNGKINYSKLGKALGVSHNTALAWCKEKKIL